MDNMQHSLGLASHAKLSLNQVVNRIGLRRSMSDARLSNDKPYRPPQELSRALGLLLDSNPTGGRNE